MEQERVDILVTVRVSYRTSRKDFIPYIARLLRDRGFVLTDQEPLGFIFSRFTGPDWFVNVCGNVPRDRLEGLRADAAVSAILSSDGTPIGEQDEEPSGVVLDSTNEGEPVPLWRINALMLLYVCCKPFVDISGRLPRRLRDYLPY